MEYVKSGEHFDYIVEKHRLQLKPFLTMSGSVKFLFPSLKNSCLLFLHNMLRTAHAKDNEESKSYARATSERIATREIWGWWCIWLSEVLLLDLFLCFGSVLLTIDYN